MKCHRLALPALAAALSGCAGYNTTMFMTKSNAGLDFDSKPPTAEINVSRKEAVIAPAFEGGQTPPVLASFKPEAGFDGPLHNFFLGVDQTFSGGDAAATMSKLYGSPQPGLPEDSTLVLSVAPKYKNVFQRSAKPGEVRPFIFGTDTMLGLKVAWSGVGGQMPDSLKVGFNRKEFAWAPLTMSNATVNGKEIHYVRMPSFLATIDSEQKVGTNRTAISALQYFATGKAATALAVQPEVRKAMLARLDPNQKQYQKRFGATLDTAGLRVAMSFLTLVSEDFANRRATNTHVNALVLRLDALATELVPTNYPITLYSLVGTDLRPQANQKRGDPVLGAASFRKLLTYWAAISNTRQAIESAKQAVGVTMEGQPIAFDRLASESAEAAKLLKNLEEAIGQSSAIGDAIDIYITLIKE